MKHFFLMVSLSLLPGLAGAQVVVNQAALQQLAGIAAPAPAAAVPAPPHKPMIHRIVHRFAGKKTVRPAIIALAKPAPPPVSAIAKPAALPAIPAVAKPVTPPPAKAAALPLPAAIDFTPGSAALPANAAASLKPICTAAGAAEITIDTVAPGAASDPSGAMRLSMDRAFAIHDALTACGIPSSQILPRALGSTGGKNPDRAQVSIAP